MNALVGAEQSVLGALLIESGSWVAIKDLLTKDDFNVEGHSDIFEAIHGIHSIGQTPDVISVAARLQDQDVGGIEYINLLAQSVPSARHILAHARIVKEWAMKRREETVQLNLVKSLAVIENSPDLKTALLIAEAAIERARTQIPPTEMKLKYQLPEGMLASDLFKRQPVPTDFVLPGFVAGTLGALIAPGSTGKSMLAMELATLVAGTNMLGQDWPVMKVGNVMILAVEDPENELFNRWTELGTLMNPEQRRAGERVRVVPMLGQRFDVMNDEHFQALLEACNGKRLLILDTMRRIHALDENDGGDMALVVGRLEEIAAATGCAILFLHHTNKAATLNGQGDAQQASRGSSVLVDNIRFQMFMVGMSKDDMPFSDQVDPAFYKTCVRVGVSKVNYGPRIGDIWLKRAAGGILVPAEFSAGSVAAKKGRRREEI